MASRFVLGAKADGANESARRATVIKGNGPDLAEAFDPALFPGTGIVMAVIMMDVGFVFAIAIFGAVLPRITFSLILLPELLTMASRRTQN